MMFKKKEPEVFTCPYCKAQHREDEPHYCAGLVYIPLNPKPEKKK